MRYVSNRNSQLKRWDVVLFQTSTDCLVFIISPTIQHFSGGSFQSLFAWLWNEQTNWHFQMKIHSIFATHICCRNICFIRQLTDRQNRSSTQRTSYDSPKLSIQHLVALRFGTFCRKMFIAPKWKQFLMFMIQIIPFQCFFASAQVQHLNVFCWRAVEDMSWVETRSTEIKPR